ncbi:hypothetical protein Ocin01_16440 [Orchesella cincta]|uniref:Glycosyltransferase family 92 protein n=1 Tax=Orchesella cincta TaxID=48709 RepID=A0A1D2MB60_ORCCI|nr:hypothetical protein Ocin01_16440 [Orchesella cincta]
MDNFVPIHDSRFESSNEPIPTLKPESIYQRFFPLFKIGEKRRSRKPDFPDKVSTSYEKPKLSRASKQKQLDWQPVKGSQYKFSVYSAYSYNKTEVVIIATTKSQTKEKVACVFHFDNGQKIQTTIGKVETMGEHWGMMYAGTFIRCPLPISSDFTMPHSVSVTVINSNSSKVNGHVDQEATMLGNPLIIQYKSEEDLSNPPFNFSVCVLPTFNYNEVFHFLEWLEFYKLLGVRHFTLYNITIGPDTSCVLKELMSSAADSGIVVDVHPWHDFPIKKNSEIRSGPCGECGLSAATNECIYRHKGLSKYMIFVDFDEFIMPRSAQDYGEMIRSMDVMNKSVEIGEYSIRTGFFGRFRNNDELRVDMCEELKRKNSVFTYHVCKHLLMVKKSLREETILMHNDRSKYIVKPEAVLEGGNHHVIQLDSGYETLVAPPEVAIVRHYRFVEGFWHIPKNTSAVPDRISKSFGVELAKKAELNVLKTIPFDLIKFNVLIIEVYFYSEAEKTELDTLLTSNGYQFVKNIEVDKIYIHKSVSYMLDKTV